MTIPTDTETDEELLTFDVSDDTLERAAAIVGGTLTRVHNTAADCGCSTTAADCGCWTSAWRIETPALLPRNHSIIVKALHSDRIEAVHR
jgi:hypothetical protein